MNIKRVKWSYLNIKKQKLEYRAELQRIKDSREVIPDPMRSEESMKLIEEKRYSRNVTVTYFNMIHWFNRLIISNFTRNRAIFLFY